MLAVTCLSVIVVNLDLTILNITLPAISAALHAGTGDLQWLVDAYQLVFAAVMLPAGVIGDRFGRKRLLLAGLAVFLAASLWCALSVSAGELIAARALMGLGAGIVFPLSLAVVSAAFGDDDDRPKAIGILAAAVALGLPLGPVLGGLLLQHFSWHSVFWINVPAVCATLAAGAVLMPESRNSAAPPLDAPGALLSAGAVTGLVWGVINGQEHGWTAPPTWMLLAGSAALLPPSWPANAARRTRSSTRRCSGTGGSPGARWLPSRSRWRCSGSCSWCPSTCRACSATTRSVPACGCCR
jgi:MFS family permease